MVPVDDEHARVELTSSEGKVTMFVLEQDSVIIGRDAIGYTPDIPLQDPEQLVSRRHCILERAWGSWWIEDASSRNGTFLRRAGDLIRVSDRTQLAPDDVVCIAASATCEGVRAFWELRLIDPAGTQPLADHAAARARHPRAAVMWNAAEFRLEVFANGACRQVELRRQGYRLVGHMVQRNEAAGVGAVVCTTDELLEAVWGERGEWDRYHPPTTENLRDLVAYVRGAIEPEPKRPVILETLRGVGYRLHSTSASS